MALETSVITPKRGRLAVIEAAADIHRSAEAVFDYCSDHAREPEWNSKMKDVEKLTDAPIGVGTRYRMQFTSALRSSASACASSARACGRWSAGPGPCGLAGGAGCCQRPTVPT
jgi:hypothetical protein